MTDKAKRNIYLFLLLLVLMYFMLQETTNIGALIGTGFGTFASALIAVYPYLILRRLFLKINFPPKLDFFSLVIFAMIIISAVRNIPK